MSYNKGLYNMIAELKPYDHREFTVEAPAEGILEVLLPRQSGVTQAILTFCKDHPQYSTCIVYPSGSMKTHNSTKYTYTNNPEFITLEDDDYMSFCKLTEKHHDYVFFDCCKFARGKNTIEDAMGFIKSDRYVIVDTGYTHKYPHPAST